MLPLDSPRWASLEGSPGGTGEFAARLLQAIRAGDLGEFGELHEQCCHQLTVGEVAYAAIPHVIDIARSLPVQEQVEPLVMAGTVAACRAAFPSHAPPIPDDLRADYDASAPEALLMATAALGEVGWRRGHVVQLLGVVAAFQDDCNAALLLFSGGGSDFDLSCPECGEFIRWSEGTEG